MPINNGGDQIEYGDTVDGAGVAVIVRDDKGKDDIYAIFSTPQMALLFAKTACASHNWRLHATVMTMEFPFPTINGMDGEKPEKQT
jgi:hypothetical protein